MDKGVGLSSSVTDYQWPTCASHYDMTFGADYDSWYAWVWGIGYQVLLSKCD